MSARHRIAADISWARTANRTERTDKARASSPGSLAYWIADARARGIREQDVEAAARNAYRAHMRDKALRAVEARRARAAAR
ncbi:hypothetical protein E1295_32220 [Nonomuraea mesophila]|uniref:Uncharacterized protein n=1 Tax=Nonomuraea mesophila TaxID=2530382 RepID=A0A4R5EY24_9ACTN|nr:hypothetical protein [Nonomuraea mesophila]TDE39944.1 hypothetical protein E1295_32220 [Nonomuraea mesophila]